MSSGGPRPPSTPPPLSASPEPRPLGGWLPSELETPADADPYDAASGRIALLLPRERPAPLSWDGGACTAICSNFRLLVVASAPGSLGGADDARRRRFELPWMRMWQVELSASTVLTLTSKTGAAYRLVARDEPSARRALQHIQVRAQRAAASSVLGSGVAFGHRGAAGARGGGRAAPQRNIGALLDADYGRMGLPGNGWRAYRLDELGASTSTYPAAIYVPVTTRDEDLAGATQFRGTRAEDGTISGRLPAVVWRHPDTGVVMARSGQPRPGVRGKRCEADETLCRQIAMAGNGRRGQASPDYVPGLDIYDARPRLNAEANRAKGGGYEVISGTGYSACSLQFLGIANIHEVRRSLLMLSRVLSPATDETGEVLGVAAWGLAGAGGGDGVRSWLEHQASILAGARAVSCSLLGGRSVLVHCTDGWDRTPQLTATAQILLDPRCGSRSPSEVFFFFSSFFSRPTNRRLVQISYRTFEGFACLIQREWLDFGHMFGKRNHRHYQSGGGNAAASAGSAQSPVVTEEDEEHEMAPIFMQWLEVVWQLTVQYPAAFEFAESLLLEILDAAYSCGWTTFLGDCHRERSEQPAVGGGGRPACFLTHMLSETGRRQHANYLWRGGSAATATEVLCPSVNIASIRLWEVRGSVGSWSMPLRLPSARNACPPARPPACLAGCDDVEQAGRGGPQALHLSAPHLRPCCFSWGAHPASLTRKGTGAAQRVRQAMALIRD
jgi:hypothetical protein